VPEIRKGELIGTDQGIGRIVDAFLQKKNLKSKFLDTFFVLLPVHEIEANPP
jgi:hypothetical protein